MARDFFISYSESDKAWAEWIAWQLENASYSTVLQAWDFRPGSNFALEMHSAVQAARRILIVLSPDYLSSQYTASEWAAAFALDPTSRSGNLIPVRVRSCDPAGLLKQIVYIDLVGLSEESARTALLNGVTRERLKPKTEAVFPDSQSPEQEPPVKKRTVTLLHLSDFQFGFTKDKLLHDQLLAGISVPNVNNGDRELSYLLITGDLTFSAESEQFKRARDFIEQLCSRLRLEPQANCFLVPGNHDVNRTAIGPADRHIIENLSSEEEAARVLSHAPTMELLSCRLRGFYMFTQQLLGKSRAWRWDRPWRVDIRRIAGWKIAFLQLNSAWALGPESAAPILGEFQVRDALTEAADCDLRVWLVHHPFEALWPSESDRLSRLLQSDRAYDLIFQGSLHREVSSHSGYIGFGSGPLYPGMVRPSYSLIEIDTQEATFGISSYQFDPLTLRWSENLARGEACVSLLDQLVQKQTPDNLGRRAGIPPNRGEKLIKTPAAATTARVQIEVKQQEPMVKVVQEADLRGALTVRPILIVTVVKVELEAVLRHLKPLHRQRKILRGHSGQETYFAGRYGNEEAVVTMCGIGAIGRDSVILAVQQAVGLFKPRAIVMIGIAFGKDPERQRLGDVLVATQIVSYEQQRVGKQEVTYRGTISQTGPVLLNRFRLALGWRFVDSEGISVAVHLGPLLSGEKLVDSSTFKQELFDAFPQAIGGEMEGAGLYAVAARSGMEWIVVKGICDWADGNKNDGSQAIAAAAAASLVNHVFSEPWALDAL